MNELLNLKITDLYFVTKDAIQIWFYPLQQPLQYKPGQFITFKFSIDNDIYYRSYSLCSEPGDKFPSICVKRVNGGLISNFICDSTHKGDIWEAFPPTGNFTNKQLYDTLVHYIFIAAGSGITPIMGMIKNILKREPHNIISLIYGSRNNNEIIFKSELASLARQNSGRLFIDHVISRPDNIWKGRVGRIDEKTIKNILTPQLSMKGQPAAFICGPEGLRTLAIDTLKNLNIPDQKIFTESFSDYSTQQNEEPGKIDEKDHKAVTLYLNDKEYKFSVKANENILDVALNHGINLPYACRKGLCATCMAECKEGKVSIDQAIGLQNEEINNNYVLTCVGKPQSKKVMLYF